MKTTSETRSGNGDDVCADCCLYLGRGRGYGRGGGGDREIYSLTDETALFYLGLYLGLGDHGRGHGRGRGHDRGRGHGRGRGRGRGHDSVVVDRLLAEKHPYASSPPPYYQK